MSSNRFPLSAIFNFGNIQKSQGDMLILKKLSTKFYYEKIVIGILFCKNCQWNLILKKYLIKFYYEKIGNGILLLKNC